MSQNGLKADVCHWRSIVSKIDIEFKSHNGTSPLAFYCLGCKQAHIVNADLSKQWSFNGDVDKPTLSPSVLVTYTHPKGYSNANPAPVDFDGEYVTDVCHSFVTDGRIQYLSDCTHELAGQTIDLPEFTWGDDYV